MNVNELLDKIIAAYHSVLGDNLIGIYLHGSLAFGCFNFEKSDIDFIVVVKEKLALNEKAALIKTLLELDSEAPSKGFEMSVVLAEVCNPFIYPTPFELHFSNGHKERFIDDLEDHAGRLHGVDTDLAAHFTVIRSVGKVLYGAPIGEVFGEVPKKSYLDSILLDVENANEDIMRDHVYIILNLCRVLGLLCGGGVLSKKTGGEWGIANISEYRELIEAALQEYTVGDKMNAENSELTGFAEFMLKKITEKTLHLQA